MVHQEQHDRGTDSRLGTAWSTFTMLGDTIATAEGPMFDGSPAHRDLELRDWSHTA